MARILAVNWQDLKHPASGGAEVHLEEILRRLVKKGHEVDLLCCNFPDGNKKETIEGVNIIRRGARSYFNWIVPSTVRNLIKKNKYDILFEDINKIPLYTPLYVKLPMLVIVPHLFSDSIFKEINIFLGTYIYLFEKPFSKVYRNKLVMVISESTAEEIAARGIARNQVHVVKCGIDKSTYNNDPGINKFEMPTLLYVGRLKKYKSIETAIDAMPEIIRQVPETRLIIVGTGDHLSNLKQRVKRMRLAEKVSFTGFISQKEKVEYLRRSHLSIYSSLKEGWGLSNIEANACGTPVLASRVPGLRDSVNEGKSGMLYEYGDINEFAEKAVKILTDEKLRFGLEHGALDHAAKFSWEKTAEQTEKLMKIVLSTK